MLRKGVRCLEIDMWDGDDGQPVVTHGKTLCSNVPLQDVVKVIAANAFADDNLFPVILSLEDHCSLEQQRIAAAIYKATFGDNSVILFASNF